VTDRDRIKYAKSGDVAIAYAVSGQGPPDLVFVHGFAGNIEIEYEIPFQAAFLERLAGFSRLITFDRRGTGLSDRLREPATLEVRMDDLRAVLDAVGSERAVLFGTLEAASMCMLFTATYPERTSGLILYNPVARGSWAPDYQWASSPEEWRRETEQLVASWGTYAEAESWVRRMAASHARSTPRGMDFSPRSTARSAPSGLRTPSSNLSASSASRSAPDYIRARPRSSETRSRGLRSTSGLGSRPRLDPAKSWSPRP
jgi:pimeloyl-ACP methyl ester carboxylesterase